jgi:hypothetical protein
MSVMTPYLKMGQHREPGRRARQLLLAAILVAEFGFSGCAGMPTGLPVVMPAAPASATVTFCNSATPSCAGASTFSLRALRDLNINVSWQNVAKGTHAQTVTVLSPDGELFQAMEIAFEIPAGSQGTATVTQTLPVIGTWITQRRLTGTWNIRVSLDDQAIATNPIQLTP